MNKGNKKETLYILGGIVFIIILGIFLISSWKDNLLDGKSIANIGSFLPKSSGTTNNDDVEIVLTPKQVNNGILEVVVNTNTHSVDLSQFDLTQLATLEYNGNEVKPNSAPKLSGHHVSGSLNFKVDNAINKFTIKIQGIPMDKERTFVWE